MMECQRKLLLIEKKNTHRMKKEEIKITTNEHIRLSFICLILFPLISLINPP